MTEKKKLTRSEAGKKGGLKTSQNKEHMSNIGSKGGRTIALNTEHMKRISLRGVEARKKKKEERMKWSEGK